jgi:hypothetical protein
VIRIAITPAAYAAIKSSLPNGARERPPQSDAAGDYSVHLELHVIAQLRAVRRPGEDYSEVILRLAAMEAEGVT